MMKLAYPRCCGADIHKNSIVATIVTTDKNGISEYRQKTFSTINSDIQRFHDWLIENDCKHVCMESTGKYWIPIFNYLEHDIHVCLTHPKYVKAIKGYSIEADQAKKLVLARGHLDYLENMITQTEVELYVRIKSYYGFVEYVSTIPGMTELSSTIVLTKTVVDMSIFEDEKNLCSWCGLAPTNHESAGKKKSVRISKAGDYLKPMMVQCAFAAIKSKIETLH